METPQRGIFEEASTRHHYLEYGVYDDAPDAELRAALGRALSAADEAADPTGQHLVVAFGDRLWRRLAPGSAPAELRPFSALEGWGGRLAPATQGDLFLWIHGPALDENLARALAIDRELRPLAWLQREERGFRFRDSRDLIGFIDGTANPKGEERREAALLPAGQPGAGGSYVLTQRWVHDLDAWAALPVAEQERVVGRTKRDSIELEGDAMPASSHVSRTDVQQGGVKFEVYRRSAPYGRVSEHGLFFLSFACELRRHQVMLERMFGLVGDGEHDRLVEFTRPVTGAYYFAPSREDLAAALSARDLDRAGAG